MADDRYAQALVYFLKVTFLYPSENRALDFCMKWILRLSLYNVFVGCFLHLIFEPPRPMSFHNIVIYLSSIITIHFLQYNKENIKDLIDDMQRIFNYQTSAGVGQTDMKNYTKWTDFFVKYWILSITISGQLMMIYPTFYGEQRQLSIPVWYPFDTKHSPGYEIVLFSQCLGHFVVTCAYGAADSLINAILVLTAKQFDILGSNIENGLANLLIKYGFSPRQIDAFSNSFHRNKSTEFSRSDSKCDQHILNLINSRAFYHELNARFIENVKHHQRLIEYRQKIENCLWPLVFLKVTASGWYHIMISLSLVMSNDLTLVVLYAQYESFAVSELFSMCISGDHLISKANDFSRQIGRFPWYLLDLQFQSNYHMLTVGSSKDMGISIGKIANLSLLAFLGIMKTSFSYLAVLRQVIQRD